MRPLRASSASALTSRDWRILPVTRFDLFCILRNRWLVLLSLESRNLITEKWRGGGLW